MDLKSEPTKLLAPRRAGIPLELTRFRSWIVWAPVWQYDKGKYSKVPYDAKENNRKASSTDPATWCAFETAWSRYREQSDRFAGVGFVLSEETPFVGIDFDHVIENRQVSVDAQRAIDELDTYAEVSPSGTGVRLFATAKLPPDGRKRGDIELYDSGRFLTVTGRRLQFAPVTINARQSEVEQFHTTVFPPRPKQEPRNSSGNGMINASDVDILGLAMSSRVSSKISALYDGNFAAYANGTGTGRSEADMALACHLAFWTGPNPDRLDRLMRSSGLMRDKWDERHYANGATYGEEVIRRALQTVTEYYEEGRNGRR